MAKGAGGPLNYPVNWELSRQVIQIPQAEANPSGVCAKAQPQSCLLESQGFVLPWVKPHHSWLPTINNEWLTIRSSCLREFSLLSTVVRGRWTKMQRTTYPKFSGSWLPWPDPPYPALPCYPSQIPRGEGIRHNTGNQRACIPALPRTRWESGGGHLTCLLLSSSSVKWRGWMRTLYFFLSREVIKHIFIVVKHGKISCICKVFLEIINTIWGPVSSPNVIWSTSPFIKIITCHY